MKLAFCLFKYFPYGGLQRDFLRIARACQARGHDIHVFTMAWEGEKEPHFKVRFLAMRGWQNHTRQAAFAAQLQQHLQQESFDLVIGFNKMPHLHLYYAADVCYQTRIKTQRSFLYRLLPRYKQQLAFEKAVFKRGQATEIMLISPMQQQHFERCYQTESGRFHLLPPGITKTETSLSSVQAIREKIRTTYQIANEDHFLLMVGSGFKTKGVDRSIKALAALPLFLQNKCHLFIIGQGQAKPFMTLAQRLRVAKQVHFLGARDDVNDFFNAADLLLHPSYHENTGTVLLEAMVAGLPVLTVASCGYAAYVREAQAGQVVNAPYEQAVFNITLQKMLLSSQQKLWRQNGLAFGQQKDVYSMTEKAVHLIEHIGLKRGV